MHLPKTIADGITGEDFDKDAIGKSGASILLFPQQVLKIQPCSVSSGNEIRMMNWLRGKLPVPAVLRQAEEDGNTYLVMSRMEGEMACSPAYMAQPQRLAALLAQALKQLWAINPENCPVDASTDGKLRDAARQVRLGLVDMEDCQPDTFGPGGFENPERLLRWLQENQPEPETALIHGDFCLPNILLQKDSVAGYLDWGRGGVGDRWCDIALCYRSLRDNFAGKYGTQAYPGFYPEILFEHLGILPDWNKIRYYILLDELF